MNMEKTKKLLIYLWKILIVVLVNIMVILMLTNGSPDEAPSAPGYYPGGVNFATARFLIKW